MKLSVNYYAAFVYRLFVVMFLFFLCRFAFYFYNRGLFTGLNAQDWLMILKGGWVFDTAAMFYFNLLFILISLLPFPFRERPPYQKALRAVFFVTNGLAVFMNCVDFIYYRFTLKRTTRAVFAEFGHETNKGKLAADFLRDYWHVAVVFVLFLWLMVWMYDRVAVRTSPTKKGWPFYAVSVATLCAGTALAIGGIRGDFKHSTRPITLSNAGDYVKRPQDIYLVLNTPFAFVRTWRMEKLPALKYFSNADVEKIYTPVHPAKPVADSAFQKKNVVIFILESFGKEAVSGYNKDLDNGTYAGFTPFLDSLMTVSKVFTNSFASGRKSIDALPSVLASIPNGQDPFVLTQYASDSIRSLPMILRDKGYYTSFFHGAPNGSMGFTALMKLLGVQGYYGKNEYNNNADYDGVWGIWDEPFFGFFEKKLNTFPQPFLAALFSVSSHHPFKVPEKYIGKFKKGPLPVLECISYTDLALRGFFDKAKTQPWFNNTLFVITADHATVSYHPEYQNAWGDVAVPIFFYAPGDPNMKGTDTSIILQQTDIMPSVLWYLNYNKPFVAFGKNVFEKPALNFSVSYGGGYRWIQGDYLMFFNGTKALSLYNYKTDRLFKNNLVNTDTAMVRSMEQNVRAFVQQYNNRLIENRLTK